MTDKDSFCHLEASESLEALAACLRMLQDADQPDRRDLELVAKRLDDIAAGLHQHAVQTQKPSV
jgi:hypothetical protein